MDKFCILYFGLTVEKDSFDIDTANARHDGEICDAGRVGGHLVGRNGPPLAASNSLSLRLIVVFRL
jgi:hypothetical protein